MLAFVLCTLLAQDGAIEAPKPEDAIFSEAAWPDGWVKERPRREEKTPRIMFVLANRKLGARIAVIMGDPYWTSPPFAVGRLARWWKAAGRMVEMVVGTEDDSRDSDASLNWHDRKIGWSGRVRHVRLPPDPNSRDDKGPILQMNGVWPTRKHQPAWVDFDAIFSGLTTDRTP